MGKELSIGGRMYEITVPGGECAASMVFYRDSITGVTSLRFVNDVIIEDGTVADGQEEKLVAAYLDNWDEKTGTDVINISLDDGTAELFEDLKKKYGVSMHAFETGLSRYLCNPANRDRIRESFAALKEEIEGKTRILPDSM